MQQLILSSGSIFRAELLSKLGLDFVVFSPDIDETPQLGEDIESLVKRLAEEKSRMAAFKYSDALSIGSDQLALFDDQVFGKPGDLETAKNQLTLFSGQTVTFYTGLALYNTKTKSMQSLVEPYSVSFRTLSEQQIDFYIENEKPFQCAGSFKSEGLGISLVSKFNGYDPNSLIGLPLIKLTTLLLNAGIDVLNRT